MANRAYLTALDRPETDRPHWINDEASLFFDSRWTVPLAWLYFFRPENMVVIDEDHFGPALRLVANRHAACAYFAQKRYLIEEMVGGKKATPLLDFLYQTVAQWPNGEFLVLDPDEIWESIPDDIPVYRPLLEAIANQNATPDIIRQTIAETPHTCIVTEFTDAERFELHLIGYTYQRALGPEE